LIDVTLRQTLRRTPVPESFPEHSRNVAESTTSTAPADVLDAYALLAIEPFPSRVRAKFQRSSNAHDNNRPSESSEAPDEEADSSVEPVNIDSVGTFPSLFCFRVS
jgi:hypothetical protein